MVAPRGALAKTDHATDFDRIPRVLPGQPVVRAEGVGRVRLDNACIVPPDLDPDLRARIDPDNPLAGPFADDPARRPDRFGRWASNAAIGLIGSGFAIAGILGLLWTIGAVLAWVGRLLIG